MLSDSDSCMRGEGITPNLNRSSSEHFFKDLNSLKCDGENNFESLDTAADLSEIQPLELTLNIIYFCKLIYIPKATAKRRKMKNIDNALKWFKLIACHEMQNEEPKLEYFRLRLIRALKKLLRLIYANIILRARKKNLNYEDDLKERNENLKVFSEFLAQKRKLKLKASRLDQVNELKNLIRLAREHSKFLEEFSKTFSGPLTENKKKSPLLNKPITKSKKRKIVNKKNMKNISNEKGAKLVNRSKLNTFNHSWVEENFKKEIVRDTYKSFIDYLFAGKNLKQLKKTFKIDCCTSLGSDFISCSNKWRQLYKFCLTNLVFCRLA